MKKIYEKDDFLAKWLSGDLTDREQRDFEASEDFETFKTIAKLSKDLKTPAIRNKKVWEGIEQKTQHTAKIHPLRRWVLYAAAAAIVGLFGLFFLFQNQTTTYAAPLATKQTFTLPDGSEVTLNASSTLTFKESTFLKNRKLQLEGEAYFKVKEGSNFLVETPNGNIQVLGTDFNIYSRNSKLNVACFVGLVGIYFMDESKVEELAANYRIIAKDGKILAKSPIQNQSTPAWTNGNSRFYLANMLEVIEELERQFDIQITHPPELAEVNDYNGGFPHNDLETALDIVFSSQAYQFEISGEKVRVFK